MKVSAAILLALVAVVTSKHINLQEDIPTKLEVHPWSDINDDEVHHNSSRIVNGSPARLGQFPYQAGLILYLATHQTACGGSILNAWRVLTAAHCVVNVRTVTVVVGTITLFSGGQRIDANRIVIHPNYDGFVINDVAMLYLPRAISFSANVAPVALPSGNELNQDFAGRMATVSGFGFHFTGDIIRPNQFLSFVDVPVISLAECRRTYSLQNSHLCASGAGNKGSCTSDSGGPLVTTSNNRRVLIGVVSFGPPQCGNGNPSGFARVTSYMSWINSLL